MRKRKQKFLLQFISVAMMASLLLTLSLKTLAAENDGTVPSVSGGDVINTILPTVSEGEKSPFDFILDPQGLIYETDAMRYGGGVVEEGATLLFCNQEGDYDFSRYSDQLTVKNQGIAPVSVTVSAYISDFEGIEIIGEEDFSESQACSVYLAVVDDQGNVQPLSAEGEVSINQVLEAALEDGSATYSFRLTGACNPYADWQGVAVHPVVTVVWHVEPMPVQEDRATDEGEQTQNADMDIVGTVSGGDADSK